MRIDGAWRLCDDKILRPVLRAEIRTASGGWQPVHLLVDIGADRTVLSAGMLQVLGIETAPATEHLAGVGGRADSVAVATQIRVVRETGDPVLFTGDFAALTDPDALDMSVLGRDITNLFAVLIDRPRDVVCLLGGNHHYVILEK